jgi:eukaryotic-like serine/threonine-protein kinase
LRMSVGADLDRYRLIAKIGAGGMATVDLAEDTRLGRRVALKRMGGAVDVSGLSRLRREALAGASLNHPNLVSVYDVLTLEDGELIIVMEYVQGETLRDRLSRQGRLAPADALPLLAGVAAGLDAIHGAGIVHRDVKPSNILLGEDGAVKVADLGVASVPDRTQITTTGSIIGSLVYMAPEQLEPGPVTPALDVYALSAVAFEVLSGVKAREAPNPVALAHAIATKPPPSLTDAWPEAPRAVTELLRRGMSREPRERPASAGELIAGLEAGFDASPTTTRATRRTPRIVEGRRMAVPAAPLRTPPPRRERVPQPPRETRRTAPPAYDPDRRRWTVAAVALGAVALAVVLVLVLTQGSSPAPHTAASRARKHSHTSRSHSASTPQKTHSGAVSSRATSSASAPASSSSTAAGPTVSSSSSTAATSSSAATGSGVAAPSGSSSATTPVGAVESFYQLAAARRYPEAWALADPAFRAQLGGYRSFQVGQAKDRSITFNSARIDSQTATSSTVSVRTTSVQSDGTRHCSGTVDLVPGAAGGWLLHQIAINCR